MFAGKAPFQEFTSLLNPHSRRIVAGIALSAIGRGMTLSLLMVYLHDMRGFTTSFGGLLMAWGAFFGIACTAPLGARTAHRMDIRPLKKVFAAVLYVLAAYFLLR